ncbi:MAG: acyl-CoA thioesterase, partial [Kiritimatiellae bacterium]|nr:acyl-CoA thioesterase [Kiritimatiellia bacterium]
MRRKKAGYFEQIPGAPLPLRITTERRVAFNEVDAMAIAWHGRYAEYFEEASNELRRQCGFAYKDFKSANLYAPIVQLHIDYHKSLILDERLTITAMLIWTEAARLNIEYQAHNENNVLAASGCTAQLFTDAVTGESC